MNQPINSTPCELSTFFAGAGGGILADVLLGHRCVGAVECDDYAQQVLLARQRNGCLPWFPIFPDVRTFDGFQYRGLVDCVSGGFPCQDISCAGKGAGIDGERSGLWKEFARIICEVGPRYVFVENSPMLTSRGLGTVLGDLASMGYDARWGVLGADDAIWSFGDPCSDHERRRIWICATLANSNCLRKPQPKRRVSDKWGRIGNGGQTVAHANGSQRKGGRIPCGVYKEHSNFGVASWWGAEPSMDRVADGVTVGLDIHGANEAGDVGRVAKGVPKQGARLKCIGNGQVPAVAALAWKLLSK